MTKTLLCIFVLILTCLPIDAIAGGGGGGGGSGGSGSSVPSLSLVVHFILISVIGFVYRNQK